MAKQNPTADYDGAIERYQRQPIKRLSAAINSHTHDMQTSVLKAALVLGLVFAGLVAKLKADKFEGGLSQWIKDNACPIDNSRASRMQVVARACFGLDKDQMAALPGSYEAIAILCRYQDKEGERPYDCIGGAAKMIVGRTGLAGLYPKTARQMVKTWEGKRKEDVDSPMKAATSRAATALETASAIQLPTKDSEGSVRHQGVRLAARDLLKGIAPIVRDITGLIDAAAHASEYPIGDAAGSLRIRKMDLVLAFDKAIAECESQATQWAKEKRAAKAKTRRAKAKSTAPAKARKVAKKVAKAS